MKHKTLRRLLAAVMTVVMLASMLPSLGLVAGARAPTVRNIASAEELKNYLEASGEYDLILTKDIDKYIGTTETWCTVRGTKRLDMHGYDLVIHQDEGEETSYLFNVDTDAKLTVYDSVNPDTQSRIEYRAYIHGGALGMLTYYRHLFDVDGKLILNNVKCIAGRAKTEYNTWYATTVHKQTYGSAAIVNRGGYLEVNGAYLSGHPHPTRTAETPVIDALSGSTVRFNFGEAHGFGKAWCFRVRGGADVRVASGVFASEYYSKVQWGLPEDAGKVHEPGLVGLSWDELAEYSLASYDGDSLSEASSVSVRSSTHRLGIEAESGVSHVTDGKTHFRLLDSLPVLKVEPFEDYFQTDVNDSPMAEHTFTTHWQMTDGSGLIAEKTVVGAIPTLNIMTDFPDFTPERNKYYRITCDINERVKSNQYGAKSWRYSGDYYALVTDTLYAPTIQKNPPRSLSYNPGGSVSISVEADGENLRYQWYRSHAGGRPSAATGRSATTNRLSLSNLTDEYNGDYFFCVVSNSQGQVQSSSCKLVKNESIQLIPVLVEQPMHGVPLDGYVEMDVPGLKITDVRWAKTRLKSLFPAEVTYPTMSESECGNPIAGETVYLCVTIQNDGSAVLDDDVKVSAAGQVSTSKEIISDSETEYRVPLVVDAEGSMKIDTVHLSFGSDGAPEVGNPVESILKQDCGYARTWDIFFANRDLRYSIDEVEWFADGLSVEAPTVEQNHTYTVRVTLKSSDRWFFTRDTVVILDGEEVPCEYTKYEDAPIITFQKTYAMMENPFEDVSETDYFFSPVLWAYNHSPQITTGTSATRFSPNNTCTRAQVVTFLWRARGCPEPKTAANPFVDVRPGQYYYDAVLWAVESGVTNGVDATRFGPDRPCTRAQVATFLWRAEGKPNPLNSGNPFIDVAAGQYYYDAVLWAVGNRITNGTSANKFSPDATCTRGQIVTFLYRDIAQGNLLQKDDFFMYVQDVFDFDDAGIVLTGRVDNGELHVGDTIRILTQEDNLIDSKEFRVTVEKIEQSKRSILEAHVGDNIGVTISGDFDKALLKACDALVGADVPMRRVNDSIVGTLRLYTKEEGGRHDSISDGYRPQIAVSLTRFSATVAGLPEGTLAPGETANYVEFNDFGGHPVVYIGERLLVQEGGRTVGEFIVTELRN